MKFTPQKPYRSCKYFILFTTMCFFKLNCFAEDKALFHPAITPEEKRLEYILNLAPQEDIWRGILDYIRLWPHANPDLEPRYTEIFSAALIHSVSKKEKEAEDADCEGEPDDCVLYGLGFAFITCSQDVQEKYFYNTIKQKNNYVLIQYFWNAEKVEPSATYRLIKHNNILVIDGIFCDGGTGFNMTLEESLGRD